MKGEIAEAVVARLQHKGLVQQNDHRKHNGHCDEGNENPHDNRPPFAQAYGIAPAALSSYGTEGFSGTNGLLV